MAIAADPFTGDRPPCLPWAAEAFQVPRNGTRYYVDTLPTCAIAEETTDSWPGFTSLKPSKPFRKSVHVGDVKITVPIDSVSVYNWTVNALDEWELGLETDWPTDLVAPYDWLLEQPVGRIVADREAFAQRFFGSVKVHRDRNFARGYAVHAFAEAALTGTAIPAWVLANADAAVYLPHVGRWIDRNVAEALAIEAVVINRTIGHGGSGDLWCVLRDGEVAYVDWKSRGDGSAHSIYEEEIMQGGAYTGAEYMIGPTPDRTGAMRMPVPATSTGVVLSIRPDGYEEFRYDIDGAQSAFRQMADAYHATSTAGKLARKAKRKFVVPDMQGADTSGLIPDVPPSVEPPPATVVETAVAGNIVPTDASTREGEVGGQVQPDAGHVLHPAATDMTSVGTPVYDIPPPDEGGTADLAAIAVLKARYEALPADARATLARLQDDAKRGHNGRGRVPFHMGGTNPKTVRRFELARGLIHLAEAGLLHGGGE